MPRELINAKITHVSYVDKAANQKQFFFVKSEKEND
ncbi:phage portal protein, partial [Bacillus safensis]